MVHERMNGGGGRAVRERMNELAQTSGHDLCIGLRLAPRVSVYCRPPMGRAIDMYRPGIDWHRQNLSARPSK